MSELKRILVTATMSAGKSTLVNAFIGQQIMMAQNESCTSLPWVITEDPESSKPYGRHNRMRITFKQNIAAVLHELTNETVPIFTPMYRTEADVIWQLIDTPGVNSSTDMEHKRLAESYVREMDYDVLLYVVNGGHLGTQDDEMHLRFIQQVVPSQKIIFVMNKVDQFRKGHDSIQDSVVTLKNRLHEFGFLDPIVQPVSARAGYLFKRELQQSELSEEEIDELEWYKRKFAREGFDLSENKASMSSTLLDQCGLHALEKLIKRKEVCK